MTGAFITPAMTDQLKGVYIPYWTFDAQVFARWKAEAGHYYYEEERVRDANGNVRTLQVQKIQWEPAEGEVEHFYDDELICASKGVHAELIPKIEWPTKELVPYNAGFLSGWIVERYQVDLVAGAKRSREIMEKKLEALCESQVPGDVNRNLEVDADWSGQTFKHILLPVWLLSYTYHGRTYQVLVDGYRGQIAGKHPISFWKVFFLVSAVLILGALLFFFTRR